MALGVGGEFRAAGHLAEAFELPVVAHRQDQVAVGDLEHLVGDDVLVRVAHAARRLVRDEVVGSQVGQHGDLRVEQCHVDDLALAGGVAVAQRREDGDRGIHAGEEVGDGDAHLLWAAAGQVVPLAGHAHQAAHALHGVVVAGAFSVRAGLAEAGDGAVDQARPAGAQRGGVQAVARHVADQIGRAHV